MNGIEKAKKAIGSATNLARALGVTDAAVCKWRQVPADRVLSIEAVTGVSRHELRPDIYPLDGRYNNKRRTKR